MYFYVVGSLKYKNQYSTELLENFKVCLEQLHVCKSSFSNINFMKCTCRSNIPDKNVVN